MWLVCHIIFDVPLLNYRSAKLILVNADICHSLLDVRIAVALIVNNTAYPNLVSKLFAEVKVVIVNGIFEIVSYFPLYETTYGCYGVCPKKPCCPPMP